MNRILHNQVLCLLNLRRGEKKKDIDEEYNFIEPVIESKNEVDKRLV